MKIKIKYEIKSQWLNNENDDLCVFWKIDKINISNAAFKTTKGTEIYTCWQSRQHAAVYVRPSGKIVENTQHVAN